MTAIQPIRSNLRLEVLSAVQLAEIKAATLHLLEHTGVRFPSHWAMDVLEQNGARVNRASQVVKFPPDLVLGAMHQAPRVYTLAGRAPGSELVLDGRSTYFGTDGCGTRTLDFESGAERPSCKEDVARMARVVDALPSMAFYWPMVSAQDYGALAPLHELEASFNNTVKHVQMETAMGKAVAGSAVRMAELVAGGSRELRKKPVFSNLICTVAPLSQDKEGIEAAMIYAQAGVPVGFMAMPSMGSTAPATPGGALVVGNAEVISALVLMQLVLPGAPVFHSLLASVINPRTAEYIVSTPEKYLCNAAAVQIAHDWGVPSLAGAFGMDHIQPNTWELGRDSVYTGLMVSLLGADMAVAVGLLDASTLLVPEQILFDDEIYHINRRVAAGIDTSPEGLALDVIAAVGPGGHFLSQRHTRQHLRKIQIPALSHPLDGLPGEPQPDIRQRARTRLDQILAEHQPESLEADLQAELRAILQAAQKELA